MKTVEHKNNFNALVAACAGQGRKEQEEYLVRLVMKLLIKRYGRDVNPPDANVLRESGIENITKEMIKILDSIYKIVSRLLLDDDSADLSDLRAKATEYMQSELEQRQRIRKEAGV